MSGSETTEVKAATEGNPASVTSDWLGEVQATDRGFQIIRFEDRNEQKCSLQMSSVADYMQPGVSAIWLGVGNARMHISFEQVKQLRAALGCWIDNGTFDDDGNRCESCGGDLGDDAPQCDDANICRKCHEELKRAERQMRPIMWAELKVDCYSGPECNQHRRYWDGFGDGDKEGGEIGEVIELAASTFPAGAKVVVSIPVCPDCHEDAEMCQCGFDWEKWAEERYA